MTLREGEPPALDFELIHRALYYSIEQIFQVLQEANIKCWLDFGTLLGSIREGEIIAWDDDIDIAILRDDVDRFKEVVSHELSHLFTLSWQSGAAPIAVPLKIQLKGLRSVEKQMSMRGIVETFHPNIGIDVFALDPRSRSPGPIERAMRFVLSKIWHAMQLRNFVGKDPNHGLSFKRRVSFGILKWIPRSLVSYLIHLEISKNTTLENAVFLYHGVDSQFPHVISYTSEIFPLSSDLLGKVFFPTPRESYSYLMQLHGPTAMTPLPESERVTHSSTVWLEQHSPFCG
jgi:lipopolysaccharide cholinephosphotransferase